MRCPRCGGYQCKCIDSRLDSVSNERRRRYECDCGHRFTTMELTKQDLERAVCEDIDRVAELKGLIKQIEALF